MVKANNKQTSIPFAQFRTMLKELKLHIEGIEACIDVTARILKERKDVKISIGHALNLEEHRASKLKRPINDQINFINSLRKRNCEYTFHVLYSDFSEYLKRILTEMYKHNPLMIVGKSPGKLEYHEVVKLGTFDAISNHMVDQVFRRLEATKSPTQLLERILDNTGVIIPDDICRRGIMYIEIRHLIVHNAGRVDERLLERYKDLIPYLKEGCKFQLSIGFARSAIKDIFALAESMDTQLVSAGFINASNS